MHVGLHSPAPPAASGVADYSAALKRALEARGIEVTWNAPDTAVNLYQIGNNQLHRPMHARALASPGVVVLHDAVLQHFYLGALDRAGYIEEFVYNYGAWNAGLAERLWNARARSASTSEYFRYGMLKRICESARAVVVHNPAAGKAVRGHAPEAAVHEIPHLLDCPAAPTAEAVQRMRQRLGGVRPFVFGVFGYLRESKRLSTVLRAFDIVRRQTPARLLVAGRMASVEFERALSPLLSNEDVVRLPFLSDAEFRHALYAVDAVVNLRYPTAWETSGIVIRAMGAGKPVIVSAGEEYARLPAGTVVAVDTGPAEYEMLCAAMLWLARAPSDASAIGALAQSHVTREHAPARIAERYAEVLSRTASN